MQGGQVPPGLQHRKEVEGAGTHLLREFITEGGAGLGEDRGLGMCFTSHGQDPLLENRVRGHTGVPGSQRRAAGGHTGIVPKRAPLHLVRWMQRLPVWVRLGSGVEAGVGEDLLKPNTWYLKNP